LADRNDTVVAGHARLLVAERLGMAQVPVIRLDHLTPAQIKAFRLFDNRITEEAEWDYSALVIEFQELLEIDYDLDLTGFEAPEIDFVIEGELVPVSARPADFVPKVETEPVTRIDDLWILDEHRVLCGDACDPSAYTLLLRGDLAQQIVTDPPYNLRVDDIVGSGAIKHREFVAASGEMTEYEFERFLDAFVQNLVRFSENGSVHHLFIDWRHVGVLELVCKRHFTVQLNLCVWVKHNGGMGSLYRSQQELVLVFKNGDAPHINNVQLGKYGRNRTNVWRYDGVNSLDPKRRADLTLHPTVKPVAMIEDAIRDCSKRGGLILDPFLGSGTTVIACEETGRVCAGMELDPLYIDVIVRRWQAFTGGDARHAETGMTFKEMDRYRNGETLLLPAPTESEGA
jgi:DNA modification methylase